MKEVKRTERGWAGHFIGAEKCLFHRNTLLECGKQKIVVSTVGRWLINDNFEMIGCDRYFETMAFIANDDDKYNDANVTKPVNFISKWTLPDPDMELEADKMHEDVVAEISEYMANETLEYTDYTAEN